MNMQSQLLEFESTAFAVIDGEDDETNSGIYGQALARWIAAQLEAPDDQVIPEDFGWCVRATSSPHQLYVACSSEDDSKNKWRVFVFAEGGLMARLLGRDRRAEEIATLFARIKSVLAAHPGVSGITEVEPGRPIKR
jgi:hypothetical protein